jgi:hypothetical protein
MLILLLLPRAMTSFSFCHPMPVLHLADKSCTDDSAICASTLVVLTSTLPQLLRGGPFQRFHFDLVKSRRLGAAASTPATGLQAKEPPLLPPHLLYHL